MDEPTNHLDMDSKDILKNALLRYDGTCILVSHDRDFLQGLPDILYEFKDHNIKEYHCDIFDFLAMKKISQLDEMNLAMSKKEKEKTVSDNKRQFEQNKEKERELRKKRNNLQKIEKEIEELENTIDIMEQKLSNGVQTDDFYTEYQNKKINLLCL